MRNITRWKQEDFSGGMNTALPKNALKKNQLRNTLNLISGENASMLTLRGGFQRWSQDSDYNGPVRSIFPYRAHGKVNGTVYLMDGQMVAEKSGNNILIHAVIPSGTLAGSSEIKADKIWTATGTTFTTEETGTQDQGYPTSTIPYDVLDDNVTVVFGDNDWMHDLWVGENGYLPGTVSPGNNLTDWVSENATEYTGAWTDDYWNGVWTAGDNALFYAVDTWDYENPATNKLYHWYSTSSGKLVWQGTFAVTHTTIPTSSYTQPVVQAPTFTFPVQMPAVNADISFRFSYDNTYKNSAVNVYVRNKDVGGSWTCVNQKSGVRYPILLADQTSLPADEKWIGSGVNAGYLACSTRLSYKNVECKVEIVPNKYDPNWNTPQSTGGGYFNGVYIGPTSINAYVSADAGTATASGKTANVHG